MPVAPFEASARQASAGERADLVAALARNEQRLTITPASAGERGASRVAGSGRLAAKSDSVEGEVMTSFGYTMMTEQSRPDQLVKDVVAAEAAGFDFSVCSDHFQPWLAEQGHAGYAWSILGAAAQATSRIGLMTYVTCPSIRYHPAIVAQKAATVAILSGNRFRLGLAGREPQ